MATRRSPQWTESSMAIFASIASINSVSGCVLPSSDLTEGKIALSVHSRDRRVYVISCIDDGAVSGSWLAMPSSYL